MKKSKNRCVVCKKKIRVMAFRGTGACSDDHRKVKDGEETCVYDPSGRCYVHSLNPAKDRKSDYPFRPCIVQVVQDGVREKRPVGGVAS